MAIVIRQDEINILVYKYLLEAGLQHAAFALYQEGKIEGIYREYENDLRAGHLIHHLERALIFNQIESHIYLSQYCECKEPMELIKPHICTVSKKKRDRSLEIESSKDNMPLDAIQRTELLVESKGTIQQNGQTHFPTLDTNFLKTHSHSLKINNTSLALLWGLLIVIFVQYGFKDVGGWNDQSRDLFFYEERHNWIKVIHFNSKAEDNTNSFQTLQIIPCVIGDLFRKPKFLSWEQNFGSFLVVLYEDGYLQTMDKNLRQLNIIKLEQAESVKKLKWNNEFSNLLCFEYTDGFEIVSVPQFESVVSMPKGAVQFEWLYLQNYLYLNNENQLNLCSIQQKEPLHIIQADAGTTQFQLNHNSTLVATFSPTENNIKVWTFQDSSHALEFLDIEDIKFFTWCKANAEGTGSMLIIFTERGIKIWDVEFGEIKYTIDLKERILEYILLEGSKQQDLIIVSLENQDKYKLLIVDQMDKNKQEINLQAPIKIIQKLNSQEALVLHEEELIVLNIKTLEQQYISMLFPSSSC